MSDTSLAAGKTKTGGLDYNIAALLCYMPVMSINLIASLIFYFTEPPESKLVRFHALQSLFLTGAIFASSFLFGMVIVVLSIGGAIIDGVLGTNGLITLLASLVTMLLALVLTVGIIGAAVLGMVKGYQGQIFRIPVIGQIADRMTG